jgi:hypothetical protein
MRNELASQRMRNELASQLESFRGAIGQADYNAEYMLDPPPEVEQDEPAQEEGEGIIGFAPYWDDDGGRQ